jgi:heme oxygenase
VTTPFSALLRTATRARHAAAEASDFPRRLLAGELPLGAYARYTEQLWFVYRALEDGAGALRSDPVAGPFVRPELFRAGALERDLAHLRGPCWREGLSALPATRAYAARIAACARDWPAGYVAHHYTRYLGDLSGGRVLRGRAERTWGFARGGDGVRFYVFDAVPDPAAFKRAYRELLDRLDADEAERRRIVGECRRAFDRNGAVFRELAAEFPAPPAGRRRTEAGR